MQRKTKIVIALLLIWSLTASFLAIQFYTAYNQLRESHYEKIITVTMGINYGNGTLVWYNDTEVISGCNVYLLLLLLADSVNASVGAFGVYVSGINNVNEYDSVFWLYAVYKRNVSVFARVDDWIYPAVSCDDLTLVDGDIIVWVFFNINKFPYPNFPDPTSTENLR